MHDERIYKRLGSLLVEAHERNELKAGVGTKLIQDATSDLEHETWLRHVDSIARKLQFLVRSRNNGKAWQREQIMEAARAIK